MIVRCIFIFVCLLIFLSSCKKDTSPPYKDYGIIQIPVDLQEYAMFNAGTYWIYRDSVSGVMDSVYVTSMVRGWDVVTADHKFGYTGNFEYFVVEMKSSLDTFTYANYFHASYALYGNHFPVYRIKHSGGTAMRTVLLTRVNSPGSSILNENQSLTTSHGIIAQLPAGDSTYYDALKIYCSADATEQNDSTTFYHVRKKGVVKKQIAAQNRNWVLIRYNITQ